VLAVVAYLVFHRLVGLQPKTVGPNAIGAGLFLSIVASVSRLLQYVVPLLCVVGAALSAWKRRTRTQLFEAAAVAPDADALNTITWREFEMLVGEAFRLQGYGVQENEGAGADGGVDLVLRKSGATYLVQCKRWNKGAVDVTVVRELYGVMHDRKAQGGFVITSSRFKQPAVDFAKGKPLKLIDGKELHQMIRAAKAAQAAGRPPAPVVTRAQPAPPPAPSATPTCPACNAEMVLRTARKGANAGGSFWGCARYPACKGTRPAA
jgi:restriction system protein